jgi:hypothetical protein
VGVGSGALLNQAAARRRSAGVVWKSGRGSMKAGSTPMTVICFRRFTSIDEFFEEFFRRLRKLHFVVESGLA